jgi:2,5-diketo-D-gluconate reductase B
MASPPSAQSASRSFEMIAIPKANGIPLLGLGTYPLRGEQLETSVRMAVELGLRHIDTAQMYGNEGDVGRAIAGTGVARDDLFIVTKVDPSNLTATRFADSVARSIDGLGGPVDLLLIHWPPSDKALDATLDLLAAEKAKGNTKAIGVSNFNISMMRRASERLKGEVVCNQVEFHPLLDQRKLLSAAQNLGIVLEAYSPLARGAAMAPEAVLAIARKHNRPASEIVLRWIIQQGVVAIPMTTKRENLMSNLRALEFELSPDDMVSLSALGTRHGRTINPSWMAGRWD